MEERLATKAWMKLPITMFLAIQNSCFCGQRATTANVPSRRPFADSFLFLSLLLGGSLHAAYPLVIDDAQTLAPGDVEVVNAVEYLRYGKDRSIALPMEVIVGLFPRLDVGIASGYQFVRLPANGELRWVDGFLDTALTVKGAWLEQEHHGISLTLTSGVKLPTASERKGLGSGDVDVEVIAVATRSWGRTSLDANVGYTFSAPFAVQRESDLLLCGVAGRHLLTDSLELFAEVFVESPPDDWDAAEVVARGGFQLALTDWLRWGTGLGTGLRSGSPDLTATTGITWAF
jgi:hypothetical protein